MPNKRMRSSKGQLAAWLLLLGAPFCLKGGAAQAAGLRRSVLISVVTQQGGPVDSLTPEYFIAKFRGGQRIKIVSATYDAGPHRVVVLLDTSGSMNDIRTAELALAEDLISLIGPADPVALVMFGSVVRKQTPLIADRTRARAELQKLRSLPGEPAQGLDYTGRTALWEALDQALETLSPPEMGDVVCLISDGGGNDMRENHHAVMGHYVSRGVRLFTVLFSRPQHFNPWEASGASLLAELSIRSGGAIARYDATDLRWAGGRWATEHLEAAERKFEAQTAVLRLMARQFDGAYRLELNLPDSPQSPDKPRDWSLKVVNPNTGKTDHFLLLLYPHQLVLSESTARQVR
jgi:VWA domain containing CoxE-like protein